MNNSVVEEAKYYLENDVTIRQMVVVFGKCRSSIGRDLNQKLENTDYELFLSVREKANINRHEGRIRGGQNSKKQGRK